MMETDSERVCVNCEKKASLNENGICQKCQAMIELDLGECGDCGRLYSKDRILVCANPKCSKKFYCPICRPGFKDGVCAYCQP